TLAQRACGKSVALGFAPLAGAGEGKAPDVLSEYGRVGGSQLVSRGEPRKVRQSTACFSAHRKVIKNCSVPCVSATLSGRMRCTRAQAVTGVVNACREQKRCARRLRILYLRATRCWRGTRIQRTLCT